MEFHIRCFQRAAFLAEVVFCVNIVHDYSFQDISLPPIRELWDVHLQIDKLAGSWENLSKDRLEDHPEYPKLTTQEVAILQRRQS